jgi:hypothetical protein
MKNQVSAAKQAVVIGGSLGGLFAGLLLRSIGWDVDIYERSPHDLDSRGGGIVLQAEVLEAFRRAGVHYDTSIGVEATERVFLDRSGGLARRLPMRQTLTSWTSLYGASAGIFRPSITTRAPSSPISGRARSGSKPGLPMAARWKAVCWLPLMAVGPSCGAA